MTLTTCLDCGTPSRGSRCGVHTAERTAYKNAVYGDQSYRNARAAMLGRPCALRLPGCTGVADTADHVVPVSRGGAGGGLRPERADPAAPGVHVHPWSEVGEARWSQVVVAGAPACLHCNSARRDRA